MTMFTPFRIHGCFLALISSPLLAISSFAQASINTLVSIAPQAYCVQRVGGDHVTVTTLLPPGASPATYSLAPAQVEALSQAELYFRIGVPFEYKILEHIQLYFPKIEIVDTCEDISLREVTEPHSHGSAHHCLHLHEDSKDPHTWLDPRLVKIQTAAMSAAIARRLPEHRATFAANLSRFHGELDRLDRDIRLLLAPFNGREFFVSHPAYGYLAAAYGLKQHALEFAGKTPSPRQLAALIARAQAQDVNTIFVQPQFSTRNAEFLAHQIGATLVPLDPLAEDYVDNLRLIAHRLADGLSPIVVSKDS